MTIFDQLPQSPFSYVEFGLPLTTPANTTFPAPDDPYADPNLWSDYPKFSIIDVPTGRTTVARTPRRTLTQRASSYPIYQSDLDAAAGRGLLSRAYPDAGYSEQSDDPMPDDFDPNEGSYPAIIDALTSPNTSEIIGKSAVIGLLSAVSPVMGMAARGLDVFTTQNLLNEYANVIGKTPPNFLEAFQHTIGQPFFSEDEQAQITQFSGFDEDPVEGTPTGLGIGNLSQLSQEQIEVQILEAMDELAAEQAEQTTQTGFLDPFGDPTVTGAPPGAPTTASISAAAAAAAALDAEAEADVAAAQAEAEATAPAAESFGEGQDADPEGGGDEGADAPSDAGDDGAGGAPWHLGGLLSGSGPKDITAEGGEYIIRKSAVKKYGRGLFDDLNKSKIGKRQLKGLLDA